MEPSSKTTSIQKPGAKLKLAASGTRIDHAGPGHFSDPHFAVPEGQRGEPVS